MTSDDAIVRLPPNLRAECENRIDGTNFDSVEEYVRFVVAEACKRAQTETESRDRTTAPDEVSDRLESLGYL